MLDIKRTTMAGNGKPPPPDAKKMPKPKKK